MHSLMDTIFKHADFHPNIAIIENHKGKIKARLRPNTYYKGKHHSDHKTSV